jgi:hypothetical protein
MPININDNKPLELPDGLFDNKIDALGTIWKKIYHP